MQEKMKHLMLELLSTDDEVIDVIKRIINQEENMGKKRDTNDGKLLEQIANLNGELEKLSQNKRIIEEQAEKERRVFFEREQELVTSIELINKELINKEEEKQTLYNKYILLEEQNEELIQENTLYKDKYYELDFVYGKYINLGEDIISKLERILNMTSYMTESPQLFMAYGVQENNIVALWESIATNYEFYDSKGKTDDLISIFMFFLEIHKQVTFKNIQIECPNIGDVYDERIHTRTASSNAVGKVKKVVIPGFCIGKNIIKKALIIVE